MSSYSSTLDTVSSMYNLQNKDENCNCDLVVMIMFDERVKRWPRYDTDH